MIPATRPYDEMGAEAVAWFNNGVTDFKAKKPIAAPPGYTSAEPKKRGNEAGRNALVEFNAKRRAEKAAAEANGTDASATDKAAAKAAAKAAKAAAKAAAKPADRKERTRGVSADGKLTSGMILRYFIAQRPDGSMEDIKKYLASIGRADIGDSTIATFRVDGRGVLDVLTALGLYEKPDVSKPLVLPPGMKLIATAA